MYTRKAPAAVSSVVTAFGVGGWPGAGFRLAASGAGPLSQNVRYVFAVALSAVTFIEIDVASVGMSPAQVVLTPEELKTAVSVACSADVRVPTFSLGRVSTSLHGTIWMSTGRDPEDWSAATKCWVVSPMREPATTPIETINAVVRRNRCCAR